MYCEMKKGVYICTRFGGHLGAVLRSSLTYCGEKIAVLEGLGFSGAAQEIYKLFKD